jgi:GPH family glycoside/pentoside/hexuronide:cation symporter
MASTTAPTASAPSARVPLPQIFAFGTLGMPVAALLLIYGVYLPRHYVSLGIGPYKPGAAQAFLLVGAAITIVRVIDVFFDPLVALIMDRTKTPIGRYRPWLVAGVPLVMLGAYKVLLPDPHVTQLYLIAWLVVSYAGLSMVTLGLAAWSAVLARTYDDRARLYAWTTGMTVLGTMVILALPKLTGGHISAGLKASMPIIGLGLVIVFPVALFICALFTPEKIPTGVARRPTFALGDYRRAIARPSMWRLMLADLLLTLGPGTTGPLYVYYFHDAKGFTIQDVSFLLIFYAGAGIAGALFWARVVSERFGKHRTVQIACVVYSITQSILMAIPRVWPGYKWTDDIPTIAGMMAVGFTAAAFLPLVRAMMADVVDEVRLDQGQDLTSLLYSMVTTTTKIGQSVTVAIVFPVLAFVGYNGAEGATNTPHAIFGLEMCYLFAPVILVWFGGAMFFGYKLDSKRHAEIREALAEIDLAAGEESMTGPLDEAPAPAE